MAQSGVLARGGVGRFVAPANPMSRQRALRGSVQRAPATLVAPPVPSHLRPRSLARGSVRMGAGANSPHFLACYTGTQGVGEAVVGVPTDRLPRWRPPAVRDPQASLPHTRSERRDRMPYGLEREAGFTHSWGSHRGTWSPL